jgi:hypothetical protein
VKGFAMSKRIYYSLGFLLIILILSSCVPSEQAIQTAMAQTQAAWTPTPLPTFTPTVTPIPFSALQLDDLIVQQNDLPAGMSGSQIGYQEKRDTAVPIAADYYIEQNLAYGDKDRGQVMVWVYEDTANTQLRYNAILDFLNQECAKAPGQCYSGDPHVVPNLGEGAMMISEFNFMGADMHTLVFYRCHAVVKIRTWADHSDDIANYAIRLDRRLTPIVCR